MNQVSVSSLMKSMLFACLLSLFSMSVFAHSETPGGSSGANTEEPKEESCDGEDGSLSSCDCKSTGDPISPYNGKFFLRETDLTVNGVYPIRMIRRYDNHARYDSPLGYGWAYTYDKRLYKYPDNSVIIRRDCGVRDRYLFQGGAYQAPPDRHTTLVEETNGTFTLTQQNGAKEFYDLDGKLTALQDRQGNQLEMTYDVAGRLPLTGTSPYALDPNTPSVIAYDYRLTNIKERLASGVYSSNDVTLAYDGVTGRLQSITASDGRQVIYQHDTTVSATHGNLLTVNGLDSIVSTYQYTDTDPHNVTSVQVGSGNTPHVNVYDGLDRVISQSHGNNLMTFAYVIDTTVTEIFKDNTTPTPNVVNTLVTVYSYDQFGFPVQTTRTLDDGTQYRQSILRNGKQRVIEDTLYETPSGGTEVQVRKKTFSWDTAGNQLTESTELASETITITRTYDHSWMDSEQTVSDARPTEVFRTEYTFYYDGDGVPTNIKEEKRYKDDGISFLLTSYTYDTEGRLLTTTLPDGHQIVNEYIGDFLSRTYHKVGATSLDELERTFGYDSRGNRDQVWDAKDQLTQLVFDDTGRVIQITNPLNEETHLDYTNVQLTQVEVGRTTADGAGQITRFNYSTEEFLESIDRKDDADIWQRQATFEIDSRGKRLSVADAENRTTNLAYDALGRLISRTDPKGKVTQFAYDAQDNRTSMIDANLNETQYSFDALSRLTTITQLGISPSPVTQFEYDAVSNVTKVTDPESHETTYQYDTLSRQTHITQPLTQTMQHIYDDRGRVDFTLNSRGHKLDYAYETWGPLKEAKYYATASAPNPDRTITYVRDDNGNVNSMTDDSVQVTPMYTMTHDALDRADITTIKYLPGADRALNDDYDRYGNRDGLAFTDGATLAHDYTFNKLNQLSAASLPGSQNITQTYFANDDMNTQIWPNSLVTTYQYEVNGPVKDIKTEQTGPTSTIEQLQYVYDNVLNVDTLTDVNSDVQDYGYDNLNRLTSATHPVTSGLTAESYGYDKVGNREDPGNAALYDYDNNNRIRKSPSISVYSFDDDGNMLTSDGITQTFNHVNRLTSYDKTGTSATYLYDPMGRRINKTVNGTTTWYLWDGNDLIAEYDNTGTRTKRYAYLSESYAPAQMEDVNGTYNVHADHLQTPRFLTNGAKQVVWQATHQAFGVAVIDNNPDGDANVITFVFRRPGQQYDQESGYFYNRYRYLDPETGRYVSADPIGQIAGSNLYTYVLDNPTNSVDPLGLEVLICTRAVSGFPFVGNHAYAWDTTTNTAEAMRGSSNIGLDSSEKGDRPGGDSCNDVEGSKGKEQDIMDFMRDNQNNGIWFPGINDCHNAIEDAIEDAGLTSPGAPGGRFGDRQ